ncbi:magnesium/cobalt transporter CorA [Sulfuriflexus sp.]|uniref:magnesium/cobalt transporter CorA n=1 Tax=Sulfuriflexus sp. TaxID=2015443 RepID=UPI0028CCBF34|nr:magnesium/cobalt transporter CorA [Sulfuriflexus sp.]MDT8403005.1 magnesium/cobalt transporter CorA [Sulfuriflexus sp.]
MYKSLSSVSEKSGLPPGSLVHVGEVPAAATRISILNYSKDACKEYVAVESIGEALQFKGTDSVTWVNIEGLADTGFVESVGEAFDIHPLVLEDILNTNQRPKFEEYDDYLFLVLKGMYLAPDNGLIDYEQVSILIIDNFVFTFKERQDDILDDLQSRIKSAKGRLRSQGADYLAYRIIDTIVDLYFSIEGVLDDEIESIEDELLTNPDLETLTSIMRVKRELLYIRKASSPLREMLRDLLRSESGLIKDETTIYYRDVYDHVLRLTESIDTYRDILTGLLDIYHSSISNKMNEIMKVLTIFASIFIPLTFIAGIYGMNFEYMPELEWKWAYPSLWGVFIVIIVALVVYFRRRKWL